MDDMVKRFCNICLDGMISLWKKIDAAIKKRHQRKVKDEGNY